MKTLFSLLMVLGLLLSASVIIAEDCGCPSGAACGHHRCPACPKCSSKVCFSKVERTKEKNSCFEVECKEICVPAITLPCWTDAIPFLKKDKSCHSHCGCGNNCPTKECCPAPRCGYVKVVKVLKKHEYECDSCGYKWEIQAPCCESGACGPGGSNAAGAPCAEGTHLPAAPQQQIEAPPVPPQAGGAPATSLYRSADLRFAK